MPSSSHRQILKSSALIGGSSVINIAIGIVRTKLLALLVGPTGVGLLGLYTSISDTARTLAGMGLASSGVRQIADAMGTGDQYRIARTVLTLRRLSIGLGILGALVLAALSLPLSRITFDTTSEAWSIAALGFIVALGVISGSQGALLQGLRRIREMATMNVLGGLAGLIFGLPFLFLWGQRGIVPYLIAGALASLVLSWWYARQVTISRVPMHWRDYLVESRSMLGFGLVLMSSGFMTMGIAYLTRVLIIRQLGMEAAGHYQAAWTLSSLYVGFILQAMGADFYPRLTAAARDHEACNRLVNEQAEISLFMATPGVVASIALAPWVIHLFYSPAFAPAGDVLRWQILGVFLRVISWPMGFILLAKGASRLFFISELTTNLLHLGLIWLLVGRFGLVGTGVAFFLMYVFYCVLTHGLARHLINFNWSFANLKWIGLSLMVVFSAFSASLFLKPVWGTSIGLLLALVSGFYCMRALVEVIGQERLPAPLRKFCTLFS